MEAKSLRLKIALCLIAVAGWCVFEGFLVIWVSLLKISLVTKIVLALAANALFAILWETAFQIWHKIRYGECYQSVPKVPFKDMYVEPHPYLPVVYKKHFRAQRASPADYPLNRDKAFWFPQETSNNYRHVDGPIGDRDIVVPKPPNLLRILCLGASTTGNYIAHNGDVYSYPMELEKYLLKRFPAQDIVVHNCGHGGWTSAEVMIDFLLNLYDTQPDVVIIYHAYNDLNVSLTPGFQSDYSHARKNLAETYHLYKWTSYIPDLPFGFYNYVLKSYMNPRFGVIEAISRDKPDLDRAFQGLSTYRRNLEHIIKVCKLSGIEVVLSTFVHYLYGEIAGSKYHLKYREGVLLENMAVKDLANIFDLRVVDNFELIPPEEKYFVDSIHFSPDGMKLLAANIGQEVAKIISTSPKFNVSAS